LKKQKNRGGGTMIPFDDNIVDIIDKAYRVGYNIPKYFFQREYDTIKDTLVNKEVYYNSPMIFLKPAGIEFSYLLYWNGHKFRGGYISINNNYAGVQRGQFERNGETLFASHIPDIKRIYKKITEQEIPQWICKSFILSPEGRIYYWGEDYIVHYKTQIEALTGVTMEDLHKSFHEERDNRRPDCFVASVVVRNKVPLYLYSGQPERSVSKAWKSCYSTLGTLPNDKYFTLNLDSYMRHAYAQLNIHKKIT